MRIDIHTRDTIQHPVIYEDDVITVYGEMQPFGIQLHAYVHQWNKTAREHIFNVTVEIAVQSPYPVFAFAHNNKLQKFCEMMGFVSIDDVYDRQDQKIGELMMIPNTGGQYD